MFGFGSGDLKTRMVIKQKDETSVDSFNNPTDASETYATRWVGLFPLGGTEYFLQQQVESNVTHRIVMHSDSVTRAMNSKMWGVVGSRTFEFVSVRDVEEKSKLVEVMAREAD